MKALEELTADIREKLPRLNELEVGCKFTRKDEFGIIWENVILQVGGGGQIADTGDYHDACYDVYSDRDGIETFTDLDEEIENVIGKEPMLHDVLAWLKLIKQTSGSNLLTMFIESEFNKNRNYIIDSWDLSTPYLKGQSHELIGFLHGLINH